MNTKTPNVEHVATTATPRPRVSLVPPKTATKLPEPERKSAPKSATGNAPARPQGQLPRNQAHPMTATDEMNDTKQTQATVSPKFIGLVFAALTVYIMLINATQCYTITASKP